MTRPARMPPRDPAEYRADWIKLAEQTIALLDTPHPEQEALQALGDLASHAKLWTYPAPLPEGRVAQPLAYAALTWARQPSAILRAALAPGVRAFADATLEVIALCEAGHWDRRHEPPTLRFRKDIDG